MKKVLITGITGFVGSHLADYLLTKNTFRVYGTAQWRSDTQNIDHLKDSISLLECDIRDSSSVKTLLEKCEPDIIFHLAAQSFVPTSWNAPQETITTNVIGELNLFEAMRGLDMKNTPVLLACSSEEYGKVKPDELPITEDNPLRPLSPYAVSKVAQDLLGYQYHESYGLHIIRTRAFNHEGPRRGEVFVISNFAKQIAEIEIGKRDPVLEVGNLQSKRDFTDVRDIVRAYLLATEKCKAGDVYVIASGKARKIQAVLDQLLKLSKMDNIKVKQVKERMRPSDVPLLEGDSSRFRKLTQWKPEIPFEQTLEDTLNYWRMKIK